MAARLYRSLPRSAPISSRYQHSSIWGTETLRESVQSSRTRFVEQNNLSFNTEFLSRYLRIAPALATERTMECNILSTSAFTRPVLDLGRGHGVFAHVLFADKVDTGIDLDRVEIAREHRVPVKSSWFAAAPTSRSRTEAINPPFPAACLGTLRILNHIEGSASASRPGGAFFVTIPTDQWERTVLPSRLLHLRG